MAKKFKDYYDTDCVRLLANKTKQELSSFDSRKTVINRQSEAIL